MPKTIRQNNLYAAEDWKLVYASFKNAEFTSYDFDSLRNSMLDYMQNTYPEEFNDYTQNSEFIALLDLVSYVGQNLAFRMDLNARENILDTAEKRESVLRIARMLSYKPKRIRPAEGLLRVTSITTTDQILDSTGSNLANKVITWGSDPSELEYERFIKVMNAALTDNNKFGTPVKRTANSSSGNIFEIYQFNNTNYITNYPVNAIADGRQINLDILPVDINKSGVIDQVEPDYENSFSLMYRNDGKGTGSTKTGFFFLAKEGYINSTIQYIGAPTSNLVINLDNTSNITEEDFFVQSVDEAGSVLKNWTRVPNLDFSNIALNEYSGSNKDLYEVIYSDNDVTAIKFGDGTFANIPTGYIRVWHRTATDDFVKVKSQELNSVVFDIGYTNAIGQPHTLSLTLQLQDNMISGIPAETVDEIKLNAPEAFYSKNRMVTGDDYNGFLPSLNNDVLIMKAENRTFSGHSRYVDLRDPTGRGRSLIEFADDGYVYQDEYIRNMFIADDSSRRTVDLLDEFIESKLNDTGLVNYYYGKLDFDNANDPSKFSLTNLDKTGNYTFLKVNIPESGPVPVIDVTSINELDNPLDGFDSQGGLLQIDDELFSYTDISLTTEFVGGLPYKFYRFRGVVRGVLRSKPSIHYASTKVFRLYDYRWRPAYNDLNSSNGYISKSHNNLAPLKVGYTTGTPLRNLRPGSFVKFQYGTQSKDFRWAAVLEVKGDGLGVEDNEFNYTGLLVNGMGPIEINRSVTTSLDFNPNDAEDYYRIQSIIPALPRIFDDNARQQIMELLENKQNFGIKFENQIPKWSVVTSPIDPEEDFSLEFDDTAWLLYLEYNETSKGYLLSYRQLDYIFGSDELIRFYNINFADSFNTRNKPISRDTISLMTLDNQGKLAVTQSYKIAGYYVYDDGYTDNSKVKITPVDMDNNFLPDDPLHFYNLVNKNTSTIKLAEYQEGDFTYLINDPKAPDSRVVEKPLGKDRLTFRWDHIVDADQTLNPSLTNIIDVYVLTKSYNDDYQIWKRKSDPMEPQPLPLTSEQLYSSFKNLLSYKMMTDEVVFHPVKFKPLFGKLADPEFQAQFKVVKHPKSRLTDSEIKSKVIMAIDTFFTPGNFGFGEIFYFTELAAYVHSALKNDLNSVVIVPVNANDKFGTLFQIQPDGDEVVTSVATLGDVIVINEITDSNIRIGK